MSQENFEIVRFSSATCLPLPWVREALESILLPIGWLDWFPLNAREIDNYKVIFVAFDKSKIIGHLYADFSETSAFIFDIERLPNYGNKGVATKLHASFEHEANQLQLPKQLYVGQFNTEAIARYLKWGYRFIEAPPNVSKIHRKMQKD